MRQILLVKDGLGVGGTERQLLMLARGLAGEDYAASVCNLAGATTLEPQFVAAGLPVVRFVRRHRFDPRPIAHLARHIRTIRPDVVQSFHWLANLYAALALRRLPRGERPPLVVGLRSHYYLGRKGTLRAAIDRLFAADATLAVANCQALLRHAESHGVRYKNAAVVYNGVRAASAAEQRSDNEIRITTLGRLTAVKRQRDVLDAASMLRRTNTRMRFWFVGDGPDRAELQACAERLQLLDRVCFTGEVADPSEVLRQSDVLVLASTHEGLPNALLEGMAVGLPVVATRVGGVPEAARDGDNGLLVSPGQPAELATALEKLATDAEQRVRMGLRSRQIATTQFAEAKMVHDYRGIYHQVCGWT